MFHPVFTVYLSKVPLLSTYRCNESIYISVLRSRGLEYRNDPVAVALSRTGVGAVMNRCFTMAPPRTSLAGAKLIFHGIPEWIVIESQGEDEDWERFCVGCGGGQGVGLCVV